MSLNRRIDTNNVVHLHNGVLLSHKENNEFMKLLGKLDRMFLRTIGSIIFSSKIQELIEVSSRIDL